MSVDVSKALFGTVIGPGEGVTVSKAVFGVIIDTTTPEPPSSGRRRQVMMGSF